MRTRDRADRESKAEAPARASLHLWCTDRWRWTWCAPEPFPGSASRATARRAFPFRRRPGLPANRIGTSRTGIHSWLAFPALPRGALRRNGAAVPGAVGDAALAKLILLNLAVFGRRQLAHEFEI